MSKVLSKKLKASSKAGLASFKQRLYSFVISAQGFPLIISVSLLSLMLVLFRMKGIEQDYVLNDINKKIERTSLEGKELKAEKASLLSVDNLKRISGRFNLNRPTQEQIIVIP